MCFQVVPPGTCFVSPTSAPADLKAVGSGGRGDVWERDDDDLPPWGGDEAAGDEDRDDGGDDDTTDDESDDDDRSDVDMQHQDQFVDEDEQRENEFKRETHESLGTALKENSATENVVLEINASRHAYNMSMEEVRAEAKAPAHLLFLCPIIFYLTSTNLS